MADLQIVPATVVGKNILPQYVEMKVPLYSVGCERKIKKALSSHRGIHSVHVDYKLQKVTVWGICDKDDVLSTVRKKRKAVRFWDQAVASDKANAEVLVAREEVVAPAASDKDAALVMETHENCMAPGAPSSARRGARFMFRKVWKKLFPLIVCYM